jgi:hypothetical protein
MPGSSDPREPDEAQLTLLETYLMDDDPDLARRFEIFTHFGSWPVRQLTAGWILWVAGLLCASLIWSNPAALVLGLTLLGTYPIAMTAALRRQHRSQSLPGR